MALPFSFLLLCGLRLHLANLSFVNCRVQVLDRFDAVAMEVMLGGFELMLGTAHKIETFVDVGMRRGQSRKGHG